jgi:hypothetical protein
MPQFVSRKSPVSPPGILCLMSLSGRAQQGGGVMPPAWPAGGLASPIAAVGLRIWHAGPIRLVALAAHVVLAMVE